MFEARSAVLLKRLLMALLVAAVVGTVAMRVFDPARTARHTMLERHHARMITLNHRLERHNRRLAAELRSLEEDLEGWKAVARREHGMILPGEVIFRFPPLDH